MTCRLASVVLAIFSSIAIAFLSFAAAASTSVGTDAKIASSSLAVTRSALAVSALINANLGDHVWVHHLCRIAGANQSQLWTIIDETTALEGLPDGCPSVTLAADRLAIDGAYQKLQTAIVEKYNRNRFRIAFEGGLDYNLMDKAHDNTYYDGLLRDNYHDGKSYNIEYQTFGFHVGVDVIFNSRWSLTFQRDDLAPGRKETIDSLIVPDTNYVGMNCAGAYIPGHLVNFSGHYSCPPATEYWHGSGDEVVWVMTVNHSIPITQHLDFEIHAGAVENIAEWKTYIYPRGVTPSQANLMGSYQSKRVPEFGPTLGIGIKSATFGCYFSAIHTNPNRNMKIDGAYPAQGPYTYQFECSKEIWDLIPWGAAE